MFLTVEFVYMEFQHTLSNKTSLTTLNFSVYYYCEKNRCSSQTL